MKHTHTYVYECVWVCVRVQRKKLTKARTVTNTSPWIKTHTSQRTNMIRYGTNRKKIINLTCFAFIREWNIEEKMKGETFDIFFLFCAVCFTLVKTYLEDIRFVKQRSCISFIRVIVLDYVGFLLNNVYSFKHY